MKIESLKSYGKTVLSLLDLIEKGELVSLKEKQAPIMEANPLLIRGPCALIRDPRYVFNATENKVDKSFTFEWYRLSEYQEVAQKTFEPFFDNFNASWADGDVMVFQKIPVLNDAAKHLIKIGRIKEFKHLSPNQVVVIPGAEVHKHTAFLNDLVDNYS